MEDSITSLDPSFSVLNLDSLEEVVFSNGIEEWPSKDSSGDDFGLLRYCKSVKRVTLPSGIENIPAEGFSGCESLESVSIPSQVTEIGDSAFSGCASLANLVLPDGLRTIGAEAFRGDASLKDLDVPATVSKVGSSAFADVPGMINFLGDAPEGSSAFARGSYKVEPVRASYPAGNATWTREAKGAWWDGSSSYDNIEWYERAADGSVTRDKYYSDLKSIPLAEGEWGSEMFDERQTHASFDFSLSDYSYVNLSVSPSWIEDYSNAEAVSFNVKNDKGEVVVEALLDHPDPYFGFPGEEFRQGLYLPAGDYHVETYLLMPKSFRFINAKYELASPFADVGKWDWFYSSSMYGVGNGIIYGYAGTDLFGPWDQMTRAQAAAILQRVLDPAYDPSSSGAEPNRTGMPDVEGGSWYSAAANWAVESGVVSGVEEPGGGRTFRPNDPVTREQLCAIVRNASERFGGAQGSDDPSRLDSMPDAGDVSDWARASVAWGVNQGVISGVDEGGTRYVRPLSPVTRAEMAAVMMNSIEGGVLKR